MDTGNDKRRFEHAQARCFDFPFAYSYFLTVFQGFKGNPISGGHINPFADAAVWPPAASCWPRTVGQKTYMLAAKTLGMF